MEICLEDSFLKVLMIRYNLGETMAQEGTILSGETTTMNEWKVPVGRSRYPDTDGRNGTTTHVMSCELVQGIDLVSCVFYQTH